MSHNIRPAQLTLTPHHLFYILSRLEELDIGIGPMNIRLENIHTETSPANYVSFLNQPQSKRRSDKDSMHSVSSVRSVMSGMSALWSSFGLGGSGGITKTEKAKAALEADLKYLYSAFTKLPSLRLSPDHRARLIRGYEEFPFDTAVPLFAFKNLQSLDIVDVDFRQFYGWDRLADQLSLLTVKRANLDDPRDLITNIVLDDADRRRFRSTKTQHSSALAFSVSSPAKSVVCRSNSDPGSLGKLPTESPTLLVDEDANDGEISPKFPHGSVSPIRPFSSRPNSSYRHVRSYSSKGKRSGSGSSNSSEQSLFAHQSESLSGPLSLGSLPPSKWRFLKYLSLADNSLTSISTNSLLPLANTLRSLNLSSNLFTEVPDSLSILIRLTSLDLSNCMIESLQSLSKSPLPAITTLKLKHNRLTSLAGIERLLSLENLNVQDNKISDPVEAARLTGLPNMHRICLKRNPLTRRTNYRLTIFNLFRNTPGFSEDIIIDESSPGYTERKLLQDRVPEGDRPPVIRAVEVVQLSQPPRPQDKPQFTSSSPTDGMIEKPQTEHAINSSRRRKVPRRRIVDLSREEAQGPGHPPAPLSTFGPLLRSATAAEPGRLPQTKPGTLLVSNASNKPPPIIDTSQDDFRQRIEALKLEVGDKWLSVLRDQGLDGSADLMLNGNVGGRILQPMQRQHTTQALVSGGRTLG
jgi:Leucine-rich repeat (LRR) protein